MRVYALSPKFSSTKSAAPIRFFIKQLTAVCLHRRQLEFQTSRFPDDQGNDAGAACRSRLRAICNLKCRRQAYGIVGRRLLDDRSDDAGADGTAAFA
ncbi:hypothetical protein, partial [Agrobacterium cavarae]|uniref:hypothetical protein n=1 Tax=Agrobacterium cavarae TaxID=2528239 RepID=UPI00289B8E02